jgi:KDO2-lipid IV(A) lauroyltransferase
MQRRTKSPTRRSLERALTRAGSALFSFLARHLPLPTLRRVADAAAWLIRKLAPSRQREAIANLRRTFGDRYTEREYRRLAAEVTRGICRTMVELLKSPYLSAEELARLVRLHHLEYLQEALAAGRGVILLTGHYGNWELLGARLARLGFPVSVVARDSAESSTASLINRSREVHGTEVLLREDTRAMLRALRHNRILGILPDQHAAGSGALIVDFLGRPASTAVGVPTLAARTGAVIVPGFCLRRPDGTFDVYLHPPLELAATGDREADLRANTELMNRVIGEQILAHPEQWLWLHRRWKVDGPPSSAPRPPSLPSEPPLA